MGLNIVDINIFYSTFTNVFLVMSRFHFRNVLYF